MEVDIQEELNKEIIKNYSSNCKKVLIVDYDGDLKNKLKKKLSSYGFIVKTVENGEEALKIIKNEDFDLIVANEILPVVNGIELLRTIRKMSLRTKFIVLAEYPTVESAVEAMKLGASEYIPKHVKINEIFSKILKTLEEVEFKEIFMNDHLVKCMLNPTRRSIILYLFKNDRAKFIDIMHAVNIENSAKLSFHINYLKKHDVIKRDKENSYYLTKKGKIMANIILSYLIP